MNIHDQVARFSESANPRPPLRLGQRYSHRAFLPEAGNTVIRHLDWTVPAHTAVLTARQRMRALPGAEAFLYTPAQSLHMTVFEGIIDTRRTPDAWPAGEDRSAPVPEVTARLMPRLAAFEPPDSFAVRVAGIGPAGLYLDGATARDTARMRAWRDALTAPFGYRHAAHDSYRFHMTFAYPTAWLPGDLVPVWSDALEEILADLAAAVPELPLRPAAFCTFEDMTRFEERLVLGS